MLSTNFYVLEFFLQPLKLSKRWLFCFENRIGDRQAQIAYAYFDFCFALR